MIAPENHCVHCNVAITDSTTRVVHGQRTYCCANCAAAVEQVTGGSDPRVPEYAGKLRCAHCGVAIVDESTITHDGKPLLMFADPPKVASAQH